MKLFTLHAEPPPLPGPEGWPEPKARPPVLLREGFAFWAFVFGWAWFLWHRLWWQAALLLALTLAFALLLPAPVDGVALLALNLLAGFEARDALRGRLARRGQPMVGVVAAPDADIAWFRLVQQRPELVRRAP